MTARALAALLQARRTGPGKWQARCPAHQDDSPSLSLREGTDGRVLVHCFAGCALDSILAALNLRRSDLFQGRPPSPAQLEALEAERQAREWQRDVRRIAHTRACGALLKLERIAEVLGAKLARIPEGTPDGDALTSLYHRVQEHIHAAETMELEARP
jgi:hypothetical protein